MPLSHSDRKRNNWLHRNGHKIPSSSSQGINPLKHFFCGNCGKIGKCIITKHQNVCFLCDNDQCKKHGCNISILTKHQHFNDLTDVLDAINDAVRFSNNSIYIKRHDL